MKCNSNCSADSSMTADRCSLKLRFLTLVINTGDLINERATLTLSISHAIFAPIALFTTYIMIGTYLISGMRGRRRFQVSNFLQVYGLVTCSALHGALSITVFKELRKYAATTAFVLNGVLPMLTILLLLADLVVVMFADRQSPAPPPNSLDASRLDLNM